MTKSNEAALNAALDAHFAKKDALKPVSNVDPNGDTFGVFLSTPMEPKKPVRLPHYSSPDFESWTVEHVRDRHDHEATGWVIVDEYGEEIRGGGFWSSRRAVELQLGLMIAEEIEAREQHGPEDGNPHILPVE